MQPGLYKADFRTPTDGGAGVVSIEGGNAAGGDSHFWYAGSWASDGGQVKCSLAVKRHTDGDDSVFGPGDAFTLDIAGEDHDTNAVLHGTSPQFPGVEIHIRLNQLQAY